MSEEEIASQMAGGAIGRELDEVGLDRGLHVGEELINSDNDGRASTSFLRDDEVEASRTASEAEKLLTRLGLHKSAALHNSQRAVIHATARGRGGRLVEAVLSRRAHVEVGTYKWAKRRRPDDNQRGGNGGGGGW